MRPLVLQVNGPPQSHSLAIFCMNKLHCVSHIIISERNKESILCLSHHAHTHSFPSTADQWASPVGTLFSAAHTHCCRSVHPCHTMGSPSRHSWNICSHTAFCFQSSRDIASDNHTSLFDILLDTINDHAFHLDTHPQTPPTKGLVTFKWFLGCAWDHIIICMHECWLSTAKKSLECHQTLSNFMGGVWAQDF